MLYTPHNLNPAYHLRYVWTGWPSPGPFPESPSQDFWPPLLQAWDKDGLRMLEHRWSDEQIQLLFSAKPDVPPVLLAARAKGRLQYALRTTGNTPCSFSRKTSVRCIGDNRIRDVEEYIKEQVSKEPCADPRFRELLKKFTVTDPAVDLSAPTETGSGRYWYDLHLVLVVEGRFRIVDDSKLAALREEAIRAARKQGHKISVMAVLPDHLHAALRGNIEHSPQDIALAFQNETARALGCAVWSDSYYAGTFGVYDMDAVRRSRSSG